MKVYSQELREHAVGAVQRGQKRLEVASTFGISVPTLDRWLRQKREQGHVQLQPRGRRAPAVPVDQRAALEEQLRQLPEATLEQHREQWRQASGRSIGLSTLWRAFDALGYSRKKRA